VRHGELEAAVLDVFWDAQGPLTVRAVLDQISGRQLAYTTVLTVVDRLHRKGVLAREPQGRAFLYAPVITREEKAATTISEALSGVDRGLALSHFIQGASEADITLLRSLLRRSR
jgi:predicted transcriptional regulator